MKKKIKIASTILTAIVLALSMILLVTAVISRLNNKTPSVFGYSFHYVVSQSMEPEIMVGDMVIAKKADISEVKTGDYVIFVSPDPELRGIIIIHEAIFVIDGPQGRSLITSGTKEGLSPDKHQVTEIIGIYQTKSSFIGTLVKFFSQTRNLVFVIIIVGVLIVIASQSRSIWRQLKKKGKEEDEK